jgi:hypothetical protein
VGLHAEGTLTSHVHSLVPFKHNLRAIYRCPLQAQSYCVSCAAQDKTRSLQTLGSSVTEQQRRLQKLRYTINELRRRLETDAVPTAEAR